MAANITDKLTHANNGTLAEPAQLAANKTTVDTTASLTLATGWPTDTAIHIEMFKVGTDGKVTAGTITHWKATLSGTTLSNMTLLGGINQTYAEGDPVLIMPTPYWANDVVDAMLEEHKQTGAHSDVTADSIETGDLEVTGTLTLPAGSIGTAPVVDGSITAGKIDDEAITLGYQQLTSNTGLTGTSYIDFSGVSITVTIPAGGRYIRVEGFAQSVSTTSAENVISLAIRDGSDNVLSSIRTNVRSGTLQSLGSVVYKRLLSAGTYTFKLSAVRDVNTGTTTIAGAATHPSFITAELV